MRSLGIAGTIAMFLVRCGIFSYNVPRMEQLFKGWAALTGALEAVTQLLFDGFRGVLIGAIAVAIFLLGARFTGRGEHSRAEH